MNFSLTKEQLEYRREIVQFAKEFLNDRESLETYSSDMWKAISQFGILGLTLEEEYGGLGESYETAAVVYEALGYACQNNGFIFVITNHVWVAQNLIGAYGSDALKNKYLPDMTAGKKIGCIAITEANAGSDAMAMTASAVRDEDGYLINGSKMFISNGPIADIFIVFAVTEETPQKQITAFVVEKGFHGVEVGKDIEKMGLKACPTSEVVFKDVRVPPENVLGSLNGGGTVMNGALELERCYEFAPHVGAMKRIMEQCIEQARGRKQFGRPIGENQAVSHKIADMHKNIELAKLMLYKIAWLKDNNRSAYTEASLFKLFVSEAYIQTCRDAMQIFGAYGYTKEYEVERELRDALACSIYSGTNEMQKNTIFNMLKAIY